MRIFLPSTKPPCFRASITARRALSISGSSVIWTIPTVYNLFSGCLTQEEMHNTAQTKTINTVNLFKELLLLSPVTCNLQLQILPSQLLKHLVGQFFRFPQICKFI